MVGFGTKPTPLPNADSLTERSRKFYDGTYKWDSDGFTDEMGVYRSFDCYYPDARAPTPLPPMSLSDVETDQVPYQQMIDSMTVEHNPIADTRTPTFAPDAKSSGSIVTVRVGRPLQENITPPNSPSIKKVAIPTVEEKSFSSVTPPKTHQLKVCSPSSSSSGLSDCPSDISEWDVGISIPSHGLTTQISDPQEPRQEAEKPKPKPSTRGIAQKVNKGTKKAKK